MKFKKIQYLIFQNQLIFTLSSRKIGDEELEILKTYALQTKKNKENYYIADNYYLNSCKRIAQKLICNHPSSWLNILLIYCGHKRKLPIVSLNTREFALKIYSREIIQQKQNLREHLEEF